MASNTYNEHIPIVGGNQVAQAASEPVRSGWATFSDWVNRLDNFVKSITPGPDPIPSGGANPDNVPPLQQFTIFDDPLLPRKVLMIALSASIVVASAWAIKQVVK